MKKEGRGTFKAQVGRKIVMALSGSLMLLFVIVHLLFNLSIFSGRDLLNAYGHMLQRLWPIIWPVRAVLLAGVSLHIYNGILLTISNKDVRTTGYAVRTYRTSSIAGRTMIWSGLLIAVFIAYHLMHFSLDLADAGFSAASHTDASGRPDIHFMVIENLGRLPVAALYAAVLAAISLHLGHGVQSLFQTLGLSNDALRPVIIKTGRTTAALILAGFGSIILLVLAGVLGR